MIAPYLIAIGVGVTACLAVYQGIKSKAFHEGATFERSRVLAEERRVNDRIETKQRTHRARTTAARVSPLAKWERP